MQEHCILFESAALFVESVVNTVSQTFLPGGRRRPDLVVNISPDTVNTIIDDQEAMFRTLLGLHFGDPVMVAYLARLLEGFARLIALRKDLAVPAFEKVRSASGAGTRHSLRIRNAVPLTSHGRRNATPLNTIEVFLAGFRHVQRCTDGGRSLAPATTSTARLEGAVSGPQQNPGRVSHLCQERLRGVFSLWRQHNRSSPNDAFIAATGKSTHDVPLADSRSLQVVRQYVEALASKTEACWQARTISPGERALLCDVMIAAVCSADLGFQQPVALPPGLHIAPVLSKSLVCYKVYGSQRWCPKP